MSILFQRAYNLGPPAWSHLVCTTPGCRRLHNFGLLVTLSHCDDSISYAMVGELSHRSMPSWLEMMIAVGAMRLSILFQCTSIPMATTLTKWSSTLK